MTPRSLLRAVAERFREAGIPDPENDSALLLSSVCGKPALELRLDEDSQLDEIALTRFSLLSERRLLREPLQYILEETFFFGRLFHVDSRVLIPRPETELLCEWALEILADIPSPSALDLCCGSGCIGLSLKLGCPSARIVLSDLSADALAVAMGNASAFGADVRFLQGDLFAPVPAGDRFHLIVSNPPYIPASECCSLQAEVLREPLMALDGGPDGLSFYRRICQDAPNHLLPGGFLLMELGDQEAPAVKSILLRSGFRDISVRSDFHHLPRMIAGRVS